MKHYIYIALLILSSCRMQQEEQTLPFYNTPDFTPEWVPAASRRNLPLHTIAPFRLLNQEGKTITEKDVQGRIYVANFFFTKCAGICPKMNGNLFKVHSAFELDPDVLILSHTVMPEADTVPRLAAYASAHNIGNKKWWLLTGNKDSIYTLARKSYFADDITGYQKGSEAFLHTENCILVDSRGRIRGVYNGTLELEVDKLIEHIQLLKKEQL
jgi:protein SCO1